MAQILDTWCPLCGRGFKFFRENGVVINNGNVVRLGWRETEIMAKLISCHPNIAKYERLFAFTAHGLGKGLTFSNLKANIFNMRKKFVGADLKIITVKKIGYKLEIY